MNLSNCFNSSPAGGEKELLQRILSFEMRRRSCGAAHETYAAENFDFKI
jgi:hypothetical protein